MPFDEHRDGDEAGLGYYAGKVGTQTPAKSPNTSSAKGRARLSKPAIAEMPDALPAIDEGRVDSADKADAALPPAGDDEGQSRVAEKASEAVPSSSPRKRRAGRRLCADKADNGMPDSASDGEDLTQVADKARSELSSPSQSIRGDGRLESATNAGKHLPSPEGGEVGQAIGADRANQAMPASPLIDQLAELQVRRKFYIGATNKQTNAVKALVRRFLGWRYDTEEEDREKTNARAAKIVATALAGKEQKPEDMATFGAIAADLAVVTSAIEPLHKARHQVELDMKKLARSLPVAEWAKGVHGLGELGLAVIIAEAGDLSKYPKKGHLWKRLGLAVHGDKAYSTWRMKGGLTTEQWTEAGYSPRRRAEVYAVISEPLFRQQTVVQGPYRVRYDSRRAATAITHEDWTKGHSHMDALRVMTKYLLRDLWKEWRRVNAGPPDGAVYIVPAAESISREVGETAPHNTAEREEPTG